MRSKSVYKVPKGKLLKINLKYNKKENKINKISITGDFFVYPEESIEYIEKKLIGIIIEKDIIFNKIDSIIKLKNIQLIGINPEELTKGILMCKK
jgi:lipoate-protein ligase A